jgi:hypothetical protein
MCCTVCQSDSRITQMSNANDGGWRNDLRVYHWPFGSSGTRGRPAGPPWPQATHPVDPTDLVPAMGIVRASRFMSFMSVPLRVPVLPFAENVGKSTGSTIVGDILLRLVTFLQGRPSSFVFACVHLLVPSCHLHTSIYVTTSVQKTQPDTRFTSYTRLRDY